MTAWRFHVSLQMGREWRGSKIQSKLFTGWGMLKQPLLIFGLYSPFPVDFNDPHRQHTNISLGIMPDVYMFVQYRKRPKLKVTGHNLLESGFHHYSVVWMWTCFNSLKSKWTYSLHPPPRMREQMKWWSVVPEACYWKARCVPGAVVSAGENTKE